MNIHTGYAAASQQYKKGEYLGALRTLNSLLDTTRDARTYSLLAKTFLKLDMKSEAAEAYALAGREEGSRKEENLRNAMQLHFECGNEDQVLVLARNFISIAPKDPEIAYIIASIFLRRGEKSILQGLRKPLLESNNPSHIALAMRLLADDPRDEENLRTLKRAIKLFPNHIAMQLFYLVHAREFGEFDDVRRGQALIENEIAKGNREVVRNDNPFHHLMWCGDESLNGTVGFSASAYDPALPEKRRGLPHDWSGRKIRIGYLSNDFWENHATMKLVGNVLEQHDRDRFEITLFCYTAPHHLETNSFDRGRWGKVISVADMSNAEAAALIRKEKIDILVDLKGHTKGTRSHILNEATAPVHVAWLGFPGTTVNIDLDYVIGDPIVLPEASRPHYYEKFCRLPETYQPNDPVSRPRLQPCSRADFGLPEDAFVFASFNGNRKISLKAIDAWISILKKTENSVIWILGANARFQTNIRKEFEKNRISPKRVFFTTKVGYEEHINRIQVADLGLDTYPYNGHTTTSEQLWAGLPVLTLKGTNFASRVSESLLNAIGLPELVAADQADYIDMAVSLAKDRTRIAEYKKRLSDNRFLKPLFDSERFCRHLEKAYEMMADRAKSGLGPDHFDVPVLPERTTSFGRDGTTL